MGIRIVAVLLLSIFGVETVLLWRYCLLWYDRHRLLRNCCWLLLSHHFLRDRRLCIKPCMNIPEDAKDIGTSLVDVPRIELWIPYNLCSLFDIVMIDTCKYDKIRSLHWELFVAVNSDPKRSFTHLNSDGNSVLIHIRTSHV